MLAANNRNGLWTMEQAKCHLEYMWKNINYNPKFLKIFIYLVNILEDVIITLILKTNENC